MIFIVAQDFLIEEPNMPTNGPTCRGVHRDRRAEPGNLWFGSWARSVDPDEYVLTGAFKDDAAMAPLTGDHFRKAQQDLPQYLQETPRILAPNSIVTNGTSWASSPSMAVEAVEREPATGITNADHVRRCRRTPGGDELRNIAAPNTTTKEQRTDDGQRERVQREFGDGGVLGDKLRQDRQLKGQAPSGW